MLGYRACTVYENGKKRTVLEHREVVETHLGRKLLSTEHVHHRNENRSDNRLENLEVLDHKDHMQEHAVGEEMVEVICALCGQAATKKARNVRGNRKKGKAGPFCGRSCAGKWSREQQLSGR